MTYPLQRPRRLRFNEATRRAVRETHLHPQDLVLPVFVQEDNDQTPQAITLPGLKRFTLTTLLEEVEILSALGIAGINLYTVVPPEKKDPQGSQSYNPEGLAQHTIRALKEAYPEFLVIPDVALDPYTSHGHDGILNDQGDVDNDASLKPLIKQALSLAHAGAHILAPSDMTDGRTLALRQALEDAGYPNVAILAYTAKYASHFYGPFRDAVGSSGQLGRSSKATYQMDPANRQEALKEAALDLEEGADLLMVKPALPYLDVLSEIKKTFQVPTCAYHVSGEYAMLKAAAQAGWLDERSAVTEALTGIKRAGADLIFTYYAKEMAQWLREHPTN